MEKTKYLKHVILIVLFAFCVSCASTRHPICSSCTDDDITSAVVYKLNNDRCLAYQPIYVSTSERVVTLDGYVSNPNQARTAVSLARSVPNVREVHSTLEIRPYGF
ncbi:BON domain-containing protein [Aquicella lusitana]|uniref:BON domain-containing protein n=1 Tax=Aquicella lusitana TaxID=254246 RepID=A0A370GWR7_9COXI|nr:BON domain-containing protein [Aquicella lusitana]RDI48092.1 BON domain-containing protein [Aquicella lusitana]VVC72892.1 hypothetical protein AQULUS_06160 [Aquicella lusitana]